MGSMSDARQDRGREPRGWRPARVCLPAQTQAGLFVAVVLSVVAGLLAMHALSSGHSGHTPAAIGEHGYGHTHTGPTGDDSAAAADVAVASLSTVVAAPAVVNATMVGSGEDQDEPGGHGLCPGARPGHCPALPSVMSMCLAVLSGAGVLLLLLLLMLAVLVSGSGLVSSWHTALTPAGRDRPCRRQYRLRLSNPSLYELCISRT